MKRSDQYKRKLNNFMFDHYHLRNFLHEGKTLSCAIISAFIFAFGFCCFISPVSNGAVSTTPFIRIVTGGISGLSQTFAKLLEMFGITMKDLTIDAIGYICFNLPLLVFAFFKVGKKFAIYTAINVMASSIFMIVIPSSGLQKAVALSPIVCEHNLLLRIFLAGMCTGIGSAISFKAEISSGGIDLVTYYISLRKSTSVGKYNVIFNSCIVSTYTLLLIIENPSDWATAFISIFLSVIYFLIVATIIDAINVRNNKVQIQIVTTNENMSDVLINHFPHSLTICDGKGAYSHKEKLVCFMNVSSFEVNKVVSLIRKIDTHAFVSVIPLKQVYGNFFIHPVN